LAKILTRESGTGCSCICEVWT